MDKGKIKIFMVHAGDPLRFSYNFASNLCLNMLSLNDGEIKCYQKKDKINSFCQMQSLIRTGIDVQYGVLSSRDSFIRLLKAGFRLRKIVKQKNISLVHVLWGSSTSLMTVLFSPVPVIISFCGSDILGKYSIKRMDLLRSKLCILMSQLSGLMAASIIVKSLHMKGRLWFLSRKKCRVIPNGVNRLTFRPMDRGVAREKLGWDLIKNYIIFFPSGGAQVKCISLAKDVVSFVKNTIPDVQFKLIDNVPHEDLVYYYNAADLMLLTSYHEGSNNSVKEAMCCNLPIISVNCGDIHARLKNVVNSYVINERDAKLLAEKAVEILKSGRRSNAREKTVEISEENIADKIVGIYTNIINSLNKN